MSHICILYSYIQNTSRLGWKMYLSTVYWAKIRTLIDSIVVQCILKSTSTIRKLSTFTVYLHLTKISMPKNSHM